MGVKKKKATILNKHLPSKLVINRVRMCENCPLHVFAEDGQVIMFGAGNIFASTIMVLPPYDINHNTFFFKCLLNSYFFE